jgi:hypothetical protein
MLRHQWIMRLGLLFILIALAVRPAYAQAQAATAGTGTPPAEAQNAAEVLNKIDQLVEQNKELETQNRKLLDQIEVLRQVLAKTSSTPGATGTGTAPATASPVTTGSSQPSEQ